ncbi:MAG: DUF1028 domain-containing protein, partial [Acidobacteria bacterium]
MRRAFVRLLAFIGVIPTVMAEAPPPRPQELAHTFSIVARDPRTGEMGVAVQSHWFSVGTVVAWAEAGAGAVATQSFVQPSYGRDGLESMRKGTVAADALYQLLKADVARNVRQVAFVDAKGNVAVWTGSHCIDSAGHIAGARKRERRIDGAPNDGAIHVGQGYSVQANMMVNDRIWPAMDKAFNQKKGDLADRLLAALDAAQAAGGDARGRQSAALVVVKAKSSGKPWEDRVFDLRVEDHESPLVELRRLAGIARAYQHMNAGDLAVEHKDNEGALLEYEAAVKLAALVFITSISKSHHGRDARRAKRRKRGGQQDDEQHSQRRCRERQRVRH